jgi:hypothetical protein
MVVFQIKDWDAIYENAKSRQVNLCGYVCVPNKQSGMGFTRVMAEQDGPAIYGIFHCLVGACSQQKLPRRGWMTDTGNVTGTPWEIEDLALKFHRKPEEIERAFTVLCGPKVDWIARYDVADAQELERVASLANKKSPAYLGGQKGPADGNGAAASNGQRLLWQIEKDIKALNGTIATMRKGFGQKQNEDGKWSPPLTGENANRVAALKEKIKALEREREGAPVS